MTEARRIARNMARASSWKKAGNNSLFKDEFERIWRVGLGYVPCFHLQAATKTRLVKGKRRGRVGRRMAEWIEKIRQRLGLEK